MSALAAELLARVRNEHPVRDLWRVSHEGSVTVWTDASSLGLGVALEVDGSIVRMRHGFVRSQIIPILLLRS